MLLLSLLAVVVLAIGRLFGGKLRFLDGTPRSVWLSVAGGVSVAYVFVHLLPELAEGQQGVDRSARDLVRGRSGVAAPAAGPRGPRSRGALLLSVHA